MSKPEITIPSFAKINLSLHILGKRPDGYHQIVTVLQSVSLCDDLHLVRRYDDQLMLSCTSAELPKDETNLIIRAGRLLGEKYNLCIGANIHLEKRIPAGGGLGGASSNAAVTLLGLAHLWELELSLAELIEIGRELGADVPFFFLGGRAVATGIGTELTTLADGPVLDLLIVTPRCRVSTADAYATLNFPALTTVKVPTMLASSRIEEFLSDSRQWPLHNDFEAVIFEKEPEIKRVQKALVEAGARDVLLTGSGSSVFGIFGDAEAQRSAHREIKREAGWQIFPCRTLSRGEHVRALGSCGTLLIRSSQKRLDSGA